MFGISFESNNNDSDNELLKTIDTIYDGLSNKSKKDKIIFLTTFFISIIAIPIILLCFFGLTSSFLWNNSFANMFDLPTLEWFNFVFGYLLVYYVVKVVKSMW
tara:strand:+ start:899 stop:1207 length:309 start_codon:yes stop_codon:yes gene_type:complete